MGREGDPFSGRRFRRALAEFAIGRATQAFATLALTVLAIRWLDSRSYAAYMLMWGCIELAVPLTSLGLLPAVQQFLPRLIHRGKEGSLIRFVRQVAIARYLLIIGAAIGIGMLPEYSAVWVGIDQTQTDLIWLFCAVLVVVLSGRFTAEMLEALLRQREAQLSRAMQPVLRLVGLIGVWALDHVSILGILVIDLCASLTAWFLAQLWLHRVLREKPSVGNDDVSSKEIFSFVSHMSGVQLAQGFGSAGAIRLVVGRVLGVDAAGAFAFLQQLIMIGNRYLPSILLANLVRPMLVSRHIQGRSADVATGFGLLSKANVFIASILLATVVVVGDPVLLLLSSGKVLDAGTPFLLLCIGLFFSAQSHVISMAMQVLGYVGYALATSLLAPVVLLTALIGGMVGGVVGTCIGVATGTALRSLVSLAVLQQRPNRMDIDWSGSVVVVAVSCVWGFVAGIASGYVHPYIAATACVVGIFWTWRWLRPFSAAEGRLLLRALGGRGQWLQRWCRSDSKAD